VYARFKYISHARNVDHPAGERRGFRAVRSRSSQTSRSKRCSSYNGRFSTSFRHGAAGESLPHRRQSIGSARSRAQDRGSQNQQVHFLAESFAKSAADRGFGAEDPETISATLKRTWTNAGSFFRVAVAEVGAKLRFSGKASGPLLSSSCSPTQIPPSLLLFGPLSDTASQASSADQHLLDRAQ
jgi:hypothetical protein